MSVVFIDVHTDSPGLLLIKMTKPLGATCGTIRTETSTQDTGWNYLMGGLRFLVLGIIEDARTALPACYWLNAGTTRSEIGPPAARWLPFFGLVLIIY